MSTNKIITAVFLFIVVLCASALSLAAGEEEKNTAAVRRFYDEVMGKGDLKVIDELIDPKYVEHYTAPGISADKAGLTQIMSMYRAAFPDLQVTVEDNKVVCLGYYSATMKKTGKLAEAEWAMVFSFRDGKVVKFREYTDTAAIVAALTP